MEGKCELNAIIRVEALEKSHVMTECHKNSHCLCARFALFSPVHFLEQAQKYLQAKQRTTNFLVNSEKYLEEKSIA